MLVVLAIIGILSIIVIVSQRTFNRSILVNYTAYDVALTIRSAETFGLSSRVTDQITAQTGYGVHFATANLNGFTMFADSDPATPTGGCHATSGTLVGSPDVVSGDCQYTAADQVVNVYNFGNGMKIQSPSGLCTYTTTAGGSWACGQSSLTMTFARPNTKVFFSKNGAYDSTITKARVLITSSQGANPTIAYVCIDQSGAIRVVPSPRIDGNVCP